MTSNYFLLHGRDGKVPSYQFKGGHRILEDMKPMDTDRKLRFIHQHSKCFMSQNTRDWSKNLGVASEKRQKAQVFEDPAAMYD